MSDRTDIILLLDRSGSMHLRKEDHEGGLRSFVRDARALVGDVRLTFVRFDDHDPCEVVIAQAPIQDVRLDDLTLVPRGGTPLLDAVGQVLTRFAALPGKVILMVITDGEENSSREWKKDAVKALLAEREAKGWKALYLGANVDAFAEAGALGVGPAAAMSYRDTPSGARQMYQAITHNVMATVAAASAGVSWNTAAHNLNWTQAQRTDANASDDKESK